MVIKQKTLQFIINDKRWRKLWIFMLEMEGFVWKYVLYYIKYDLADFIFLPLLLYYLTKSYNTRFTDLTHSIRIQAVIAL